MKTKPDWRESLINWIIRLFFKNACYKLNDPDKEYLVRKRDLWNEINKINVPADVDLAFETLYEFSFHYKYRSDINVVVAEMEQAIHRKDYLVTNLSKVQ